MTLSPRISATLSLMLMVAACGRTEPVGDTPSPEELAAAANAAAANAVANQAAEAEPENRNYVNATRGFSITFPEGWTIDKGASSPDGVVYQDPGAGADVRVFWQAGKDGQSIQQMVAALSSGSEGVDGDYVGDDEYRGTANDGEGNNVAIRLLRQQDGSVVTATFVYPEMLSEQYSGIADTVLNSLRLFEPEKAAKAEKETGNAPAANASN